MAVEILPSEDNDPTCQTFVFRGEDHSFANSLRMTVNFNEDVEFCGYTIVHPMDDSFRIRIQTNGNITALDALKKGLDDLSEITVRVMTDFKANLDNTKSYTVEHSAQW